MLGYEVAFSNLHNSRRVVRIETYRSGRQVSEHYTVVYALLFSIDAVYIRRKQLDSDMRQEKLAELAGLHRTYI